jgi:hypothetical protein
MSVYLTKKGREIFIRDKTENYEQGNPHFTTLLGEQFYPDDFWFPDGGIIIRTPETFKEIEKKIYQVMCDPIYSSKVNHSFIIQYTADLECKHPIEDRIVPGIQIYDLFVKHHKEMIPK